MKDFLTFLRFLNNHNPFDVQYSALRNIFTGLTDSQHIVNVDAAQSIGIRIQDKLTGTTFSDVAMTKSREVGS